MTAAVVGGVELQGVAVRLYAFLVLVGLHVGVAKVVVGFGLLLVGEVGAQIFVVGVNRLLELVVAVVSCARVAIYADLGGIGFQCLVVLVGGLAEVALLVCLVALANERTLFLCIGEGGQ